MAQIRQDFVNHLPQDSLLFLRDSPPGIPGDARGNGDCLSHHRVPLGRKLDQHFAPVRMAVRAGEQAFALQAIEHARHRGNVQTVEEGQPGGGIRLAAGAIQKDDSLAGGQPQGGQCLVMRAQQSTGDASQQQPACKERLYFRIGSSCPQRGSMLLACTIVVNTNTFSHPHKVTLWDNV